MAPNSSKTLKKGRSPYKMLLLTALIIPCVNNLVLGTLSCFTYYYQYLFTIAPFAIVHCLYSVIKCSSLIMTIMTLNAHVRTNNVFKRLGVVLAFSIGEQLSALATVVLSHIFEINDKPVSLSTDLLLRLPNIGVGLLTAFFSFSISLIFYIAVQAIIKKAGSRKKQSEQSPTNHVRSATSPFIYTTLLFILFYTIYLLIDSVLSKYVFSTFVFENPILCVVYPLIYGGFMVLTALKFSDKLSLYYKHRFLSSKKKNKKEKM